MKGVANIIGFVLMAVLITAGSYLAYQAAREQAKRMEHLKMISEAVREMSELDKTIKRIASSSPGAREKVEIPARIFVRPEARLIYMTIDSPIQILPPGVKRLEEGVVVSGGTDVLGYDNGTHIVIENSIIRMSVEKLGSPSAPALVNISKIILLENKITGQSISPGLKVKISDQDVSSGYGYTELVTEGSGLPEGIIKVRVEDSAAPYNFTLILTIESASDYISMKVREIEKN